MRGLQKTAAVALLGVGLVVVGVVTTRRQPGPEETLRRVSDRLICRCGCNQHLNGCTHHPCGSADPMRAQIKASIAAGKDEDAIVQEFVQQMGAVILAAPPAKGVSLAAWIMPVAAVLLGLLVLYRVLRSAAPRRGAPPAAAITPAPAAKPDAGVQRYVASIDEELERET